MLFHSLLLVWPGVRRAQWWGYSRQWLYNLKRVINNNKHFNKTVCKNFSYNTAAFLVFRICTYKF